MSAAKSRERRSRLLLPFPLFSKTLEMTIINKTPKMRKKSILKKKIKGKPTSKPKKVRFSLGSKLDKSALADALPKL